MSHVDEGTLHALLDGELTAEEAQAVESHIGGCAACRAALAEARALVDETEVLITDLDEVDARAANTTAPARRRLPRMRTMALAASVVLAVGATYVIYSTTRVIPQPESVGAGSPDSAARPEETTVAPAPAPVPAAPPAGDAAGREAPAERRDRAAEPVATPPAAPAPTDELQAAARRQAPVAQEAEPQASADRLADAGAEDQKEEVDAAGANVAPTSLEVAVASLGGAIRLIDGMTPVRVDTTSIDAQGSVVQIVYQDSLDRPVTLEQFRVADGARVANERRAGEVRAAPPVAAKSVARRLEIGPGDTVITARPDGTTAIRWMDGSGFLLTLVGSDRDYLLRLIPRVH